MEGQNAAKEVNLMDVRGMLLNASDHADRLISSCADLRDHVAGSLPPSSVKEDARVAAVPGVVNDLNRIATDLGDKLQRMDVLVAFASQKLGVPQPPRPEMSTGPRLARG